MTPIKPPSFWPQWNIFQIAFTKADKLKPNALKRNIEAYEQKMLETWEEMPQYFVTSSSHDTGRDEMLAYNSRR